jgi:hypothetical protein
MTENESPGDRDRFCSQCGTAAAGEPKFCGQCGNSLMKPGPRPAAGPTAHVISDGAVPSLLRSPPKRGWAHGKTFYLYLISITVACTVVSIVLLNLPGGPLSTSYNDIAPITHVTVAAYWIGLVGILGWLGLGYAVFNRIFGGLFDRAFARVPSPEEIHNQLRLELRREPSLDEVLSVQRYLSSNRNEALVGVGALLIGSHFAANRARGRPF